MFSTIRCVTRPKKFQNNRHFFTIIQEYERGVKFNLGKYKETLKPGFRLWIPFYHTIKRVEMTDRLQNMYKLPVISEDNAHFTITCFMQYKVIDAEKLVLSVKDKDLDEMLLRRCEMSLRTVFRRLEYKEILYDTELSLLKVKRTLKTLEQEWGIEVLSIQMKDIVF